VGKNALLLESKCYNTLPSPKDIPSVPRKPPYKIERIANLAVDENVLAKVRLLLLDPVSKHVRWGALSYLINNLLTRWVEEQQHDSSEAERLRTGERYF
jgi:hypothetical protein